MEVQDAVKESVKAVGEIFAAEKLRDLRLEEVQLSDDESTWLTTLSFRNPDKPESETVAPSNGLEALFLQSRPKYRAYKTVKLRAADGKLLGITNRD